MRARSRSRSTQASQGPAGLAGATRPEEHFLLFPTGCVCVSVTPCGKRARRSGLLAMPCALATPEVHFVTLADCTYCESLVPTGIVLTFVRARIRTSLALHAARMLLTRLALDSHECGSVIFHVLLPPSCSFFDGALCVDSRLNSTGAQGLCDRRNPSL